jgi:hypothetical protein
MALHFRCTSCGDVIGVYEPTVVVDEHGVRHTSLAADPDIRLQRGDAQYHRSCYAALDNPAPPVKP